MPQMAPLAHCGAFTAMKRAVPEVKGWLVAPDEWNAQ
jgi:hypothetical protein